MIIEDKTSLTAVKWDDCQPKDVIMVIGPRWLGDDEVSENYYMVLDQYCEPIQQINACLVGLDDGRIYQRPTELQTIFKVNAKLVVENTL